MASSKLLLSTSSILIFSLVLVSLSTFSSACDCGGSPLPPVHPKSPPPVKHSPPPIHPKSPPPVKHSPPPVHPKSPPPVKHSPPPVHPRSPPPVKHSPPPAPKSPPKTSVPPPSPPKSPSSSPPAVCPIDTLKLGVCANLLGSSIVGIGSPASSPCCSLLNGLADLQAALCLCTAIKADVLGIHLNVPVSLSLILNDCGKSVPSGFKCA